MKSPRVLQQQFLSDVFRDLVARHRPRSIAVLGCATGNGFEHIDSRITPDVVGIDINPEYLEILLSRFAGGMPGLRTVLCDIAACDLEARSIDVAHCALVFEYVDPRVVLAKTAEWLHAGGVLSVVLQLPSPGHEKVADTEFKEILSCLDPILHLVDPEDLARLAAAAGLRRGTSEVRRLATGKSFCVAEFVRESRP